MNLLLDTHVFLWWLADDPSLSKEARAAIADGETAVYVSAAVAWEIAIKSALGHLSLYRNPRQYVVEQCLENGLLPQPIDLAQAGFVHELPNIHNDPFGRTLVAQAKLERLSVVTKDSVFAKYEVATVW